MRLTSGRSDRESNHFAANAKVAVTQSEGETLAREVRGPCGRTGESAEAGEVTL
jgi:hypothetical protein